MKLSESLENYLEAIYHIVEKKGAARAKDIALALDVKNASVTDALRTLKSKELVNYLPYDVITLTDKGKELAQAVADNHHVLEMFLEKGLGLESETASEIACKMEHVVNPELILKLERLTKFLVNNEVQWDK
ncbi:MAG: metal-dependent transcriptional regulator [Lentisphaeria bacterium]